MANKNNCINDAPGPVLIAGPCAAESRKQILETAGALTGTPYLYAFRAGLWKPRTRPGEFEGVGEKGLPWLIEAREKTNLKLAVEIAMPAHAEACIKAGIDMVWIGARTIVSPFIIDEIASVLSGGDLCVMVKNPVNPDLDLWVGGIERLKKSGIQNLAAVHRGFDAFSSKPYRNIPLWEIPIELMRIFPDLPVFCDPSHICGRRDLLPGIAQQALNFGMRGLMIESHIDPDHALTDIAQQITPDALKKMIAGLEIKTGSATTEDNRLVKYRTSIDELDGQILELLSKRMQISKLIGEYKKEINLRPFQAERWSSVIHDRLGKAAALELDKEFIKRLFDLIHLESLRKQS